MQKDHEEAKETQGESKQRATGTTRARAEAPTALPPVAAMSHEGSPELPRRVVDKVLGNLQHLPDSWPLMRFDLMLHKSDSFYAIWRRFLHLNEYLRNNLLIRFNFKLGTGLVKKLLATETLEKFRTLNLHYEERVPLRSSRGIDVFLELLGPTSPITSASMDSSDVVAGTISMHLE